MAPDADALLQHAAGIRALLRGLLADDARIDDVLQDTWLAALSKGPRAGVPLGPWLKRVALNFARRVRRGEARRAARERVAARPDETAGARFDLQREVVDELAKLDEPYRSTLILRFFEGLSPKEIAERRGIPAATVRSHLKRGLDRIRERLDKGHGSRGAWGAVFLPWLATRKAAAGVIAMSVKTKLVLASALVLALAGGTAFLWHTSQRIATLPPRAAAAHDATPAAATEPEVAGEATPAQSERERSFVLRGRIVDATTKRPVADTPLRIVVAGEDRTLDLVTDAAGVFSGTSPILSEGALGSYFGHPSHLLKGMAVAVQGFAVCGAPSGKPAREGTLDLGDIEVSRGVPVSGRVVRRDGTGVAGAAILFSFEGPAFPPAWAVAMGRSGADGRFVLEEPVPVTKLWPWTLMAICEEGLGCLSLDVLPGRDRIDGVEIVIESAAPLEVTVTDDEGMPLADARVSLEPRFAPLEWQLGRTHDHSLWHGRRADALALFREDADAQGRAVFARLPLPGPYDVVARAKGHTKGWQDDVAVDRGERRAVTIRLPQERLCVVSGTVLSEEDGSPVVGARVGPWATQTVATDGSGKFRIEGLDPSYEKLALLAEAKGYASSVRDVPLPADHDVEGLEIRLERATPIGGRVVDDRGKPVSGAYLDLLRRGRQLRPDQSIGPDGRFVFPDATKGQWKLRVSAPESDPDLEDWREIAVRGGDTEVEVVLRRLRLGTTKLLARVVEAGTGKALDPADAFLLRRDYEAQTPYAQPAPLERRSGEIAGEKLHPDAWRLWVRVPGYAPGYVDFTVVEGQADVQREIRLGHGGRITGRVVGAPGARAVLTMPAGSECAPGQDWEADGRIRGYARVASDGTFVIENVVPGPTTVTLEASGFLGTATTDVPSGGDAQVEITAAPAARLSFRSSAPLPDAVETVGFYVSQEPEKWRCVMNLGGYSGRIVGYQATLPAGRTRWRVVFDSAGLVRTQEGVVDLVVGETAEVVVPIEVER